MEKATRVTLRRIQDGKEDARPVAISVKKASMPRPEFIRRQLLSAFLKR